jgi:hypothetical protein
MNEKLNRNVGGQDMKTPEELSTLFDDPAKALAILNRFLASNNTYRERFSKEEVLDRLTGILMNAARKKGKLRCTLLENELVGLTGPKSSDQSKWRHDNLYSSVEDWSETFDDLDADDWESLFDPGAEHTDPKWDE